MPTYVYECSSCNTTFEAEQRIVEPPLDTCVCGSKGSVKRVIQPVGIAFKGSGFHINDYSAPKAPAETASTSTSETPAATTETASPAPAAPTTVAPASTE